MNNSVEALVVNTAGDLYAIGSFTQAGSCNSAAGCNYVARWDGTVWRALGSGLSQGGGALTLVGETLWAGGAFTRAGDAVVGYLAQWDGSAWSSDLLGNGANAHVYALVAHENSLFAGGNFSAIGDCIQVEGCRVFAGWNGNHWYPLGSELHNTVYALAVDSNGVLYAGGNVSGRIAQWDGSAWSAVGGGVDGLVSALAVDTTGHLYVGGEFTQAGACTSNCNRIARWDGTQWTALDSGMNNAVKALAVDDQGNLYAGGSFTRAGACTSAAGCNRIARWDGAQWHPLGTGMNGVVLALATERDSTLYAGGQFTHAGHCDSTAGCNYIARWDGTQWSALSSGMDHPTLALATDGSGDLYAGGRFKRAGGCDSEAGCNHIARWDGSEWHPLLGGMNQAVEALQVVGESLWVGGWFTAAGDTPSGRIARWDGPLSPTWTPTATATPLPSMTPTATATGTPAVTPTPTPSSTPTLTATATLTSSTTSTATTTTTPSSTVTVTPTGTATVTASKTPSPTMTLSTTVTVAATLTPTATPTATSQLSLFLPLLLR
jgi:hypothetical protein